MKTICMFVIMKSTIRAHRHFFSWEDADSPWGLLDDDGEEYEFTDDVRSRFRFHFISLIYSILQLERMEVMRRIAYSA